MIKRKILAAVKRLELDLTGKVVLTEAATGAYTVTPIIAALAGAKVYAFTKDTKYGSVSEVREQTYKLLKEFSINESQLVIIDELTPEIISKADIITNSGHLRPLNEYKLKYAKPGVVIPLMFEAWEWRDADLDLNFCRTKQIHVGATNERHPGVDVFNYLGDMALKMIFDAGLCAYKNNFVLMCNNDFGPFIAKVLSKVCANLGVCDTEVNKPKYDNINIDWIGNFPNFDLPEKYKSSSAVILSAYPFDKNWIGKDNEPISITKLKDHFDAPFILRYVGDINEVTCENEILFHPKKVTSGHMGIIPSGIGWDPILRLQSGGLKVGELMMKGETSYLNIPIVQKI